MRSQTSRWILGGLVGFMAVGAGIGLRAAEGPSEKELDEAGLKRAGPLLVLAGESEVHTKADELRKLSRQLSHAIAQQRSMVSEKEYQETIKELTAEVNQLKAQINTATQTMNRIPKRRGYPANNILAEEYQELNYYRVQLQQEVDQRQAFLNQLKSKPFDPKARIQADTEVRNGQESLHQAAQELRKLVDAVTEKYAAVAKDPRVKKWLDTPEGTAHVKPKLGPSGAFRLDVKMLEQIERAAAADEPGASPAKATRKGRRAKAKRATGADNASSPF